MALLVGCLHAVGQLHKEHAVILDVENGTVITTGRGGPMGGADVHFRSLAALWSAGLAIVDAELTHADDAAGVGASEPVDDVDVVGSFLQEKPVSEAPLGMPVFEVGISPIADKVAAPDGLDPADGSGGDEFVHLAHNREETHVVADIEFHAVFSGGGQDAIAALDGDGHGLFEKDMLACGERGESVLFVKVIGSANENGVEFGIRKNLPVVFGESGARTTAVAIEIEIFRAEAADRGQTGALLWMVRQKRNQTAAVCANHPESNIAVVLLHELAFFDGIRS